MSKSEWRRIISTSPILAAILAVCLALSAILGIIGLLADILGWR